MKSVYTLTLNPALDKSTTVKRVVSESKLRCEDPRFDPGGGGINVSRAVKRLGGDTTAIYPKGGYTGNLMEDLLKEEGVNQNTVSTESWTRENFIVVESEANRQFRFGMPGAPLTSSELDRIFDLCREQSDEIDFLVASGSLPPGVPDDYLEKLAVLAKEHDIRFILDTSGEPLKKAVNEGVYLLKPNLGELSTIAGKELTNVNDQEEAAMEVIEKGMVEVLVVSLGPMGAMVASKDEGIYHIPAPSVKKQSTVGAGDSMVGGIIYSIAQGNSLLNAVQYGVACGTAATMNPGTELFKKDDVENLIKWIKKRMDGEGGKS